MLKSYFTIAFRNLVKNRVSSAINIGGLAVGMAVAILIGLWIYDEVSFDKYHRNYDHIAQVLQNQTFNGEVQTWYSQAMQLGPELRSKYGSDFKHIVMSSWTGDHLLSFGEKKVTQSGNFMEPEVTDLLTLTMLKGGAAALKDPSSIILSAGVARSLFGDADPMGKLLKIDNKLDVKVTGVYADLPDNSTFSSLHFIAPWELKIKSEGWDKTLQWGNSWFQTIVQIADNADMARVSAAIKNAKLNAATKDDARFKPELFLYPMSRWHLYSDFKNGASIGGRIQYVKLFGVIGFFVLILACINFMNLSTARSEKRAKEVGIRKAIGSLRGQLVGQFFSESLLVALLAFLLALALVQLLLPFFNGLSEKKMFILWSNPLFWLAGLGFSLITGLIAGSYPAIYLSSFRPVKVLKGTFRVGRMASIPRKVLVVVQFTVSVVLIIGTIVIFRQIQYAKDRPVGYSRNGLIAVPIKSDNIHTHYDALRAELMNTGVVQEVAASESPVTAAWVTNSGFKWKGKDPSLQEEFVSVRVTPEFGKTAGWEIKEGRDFSATMATDSSAFIINEAAAKYIGMEHPVGETIKWGDDRTYRIIGVVKDMVMQSPYEPVKQTFFFLDAKRTALVDIRILPQVSVSAALGKIETIFRKYDPADPFDYQFADQEYAKKFGYEERIGRLATFFAVLAIFISCLGLFGLASFMAEQRTREIGVRKVLGASVANVWRLLSGEFVGLVMISLLIAGPVAWFLMQDWLQSYRYRSPISWWIFAAAGGGALAITLLTVSWQAVRAALMNPVKSLRTE